MSAQIIDGKAVGAKLREAIKAEAAQLTAAGTTPGLAVILVGDDPASHVMSTTKRRAAPRSVFIPRCTSCPPKPPRKN